MRTYILAAALLALGVSQRAAAQAPFVYKPIDTNKMLVQPADAASAITAGATTSTFRTITRSVAGAIENNGFVKTVNNLLGRRAKPTPVQAGFSPLPLATSHQSAYYPNSFTPQMPIAHAYGQSPAIPLPTSPSPTR
jgi:hypothetical protein